MTAIIAIIIIVALVAIVIKILMAESKPLQRTVSKPRPSAKTKKVVKTSSNKTRKP